jgi:hypothetical protein
MVNQRRVLYLQPSDSCDGPERQVAAVLPHLRSHGIAVTALVGPGHTLVAWLRAAGLEDVVHSPSFPRDVSDARGVGPLTRAQEFVMHAGKVERQVEDLIDARRIDAVVGGMAFSWVSATRAARRKGIPVLWRVGGMELSSVERLILPLWARRNPPDALICNGEGVRDLYSPLIPAPAYVVDNGVDSHVFGGSLPPSPFPPSSRSSPPPSPLPSPPSSSPPSSPLWGPSSASWQTSPSRGPLSASVSAAALAEVIEGVLRGTAPREIAAARAS